MEYYELIIEFLKKNNFEYEEYEHQPVYTSKEASEVRGGGVLSQGAKALVFDLGRPVMMVVRGSDKVDGKIAKLILKVKEVPLATPEKVLEYTTVSIGAVAPFGFLKAIDTYVDKNLFENEYIMFNPGKHNKTIKMLASDYKSIKELKIAEFSK